MIEYLRWEYDIMVPRETTPYHGYCTLDLAENFAILFIQYYSFKEKCNFLDAD
jgi:hypothetical protein